MSSKQVAPRASSPTLVVVATAAAVLLVAMIQTLTVPALPQIGAQLGVSLTAVGWVTTSTMLAASAFTPLVGRLGDVYGHKRLMLVARAVTLLGSLLAALGDSIQLLIVGRVLQGAGFGLFPLAISVLREELAPSRLGPAMAITASALGVGSGLALVATGLLTSGGAAYRRIFWLCVVIAVLLIALVARVIPDRGGPGGQVDYWGALLLAIGLVCLLLPTSQGHEWGWGSVAVIGLYALALVVLIGFWIVQSRRRTPLVSVELLTHRAVLATNLTSMCVGFAMFSFFLGATYFIQTPHAVAGYGFSATVLATSVVYMLPAAVGAVAVGPIAGTLVQRVGPKLVLLGSCIFGLLGLLFMAFFHQNTAQMIIGLAISNMAIAGAFGSMPALLVANVEPRDTGIANSINSILRTLGGAFGSAVVITVLAAQVSLHTVNGAQVAVPTEAAYRLSFLVGAAALGLAALMIAFLIPQHRPPEQTEDPDAGDAPEPTDADRPPAPAAS